MSWHLALSPLICGWFVFHFLASTVIMRVFCPPSNSERTWAHTYKSPIFRFFFRLQPDRSAEMHFLNLAAKPEQHWAGLLPASQHPSFTNLCNGRANDGKAACTSENSNLNAVATAVTPLHCYRLVISVSADPCDFFSLFQRDKRLIIKQTSYGNTSTNFYWICKASSSLACS